MVAQQDLAFKMIHIEAKSINIWPKYDPKHSCFLTSTQTWGDIPFWVISQPNVDRFCSNMDDLKALAARQYSFASQGIQAWAKLYSNIRIIRISAGRSRERRRRRVPRECGDGRGRVWCWRRRQQSPHSQKQVDRERRIFWSGERMQLATRTTLATSKLEFKVLSWCFHGNFMLLWYKFSNLKWRMESNLNSWLGEILARLTHGRWLFQAK